jgi:tryptophan synthase alpha chain
MSRIPQMFERLKAEGRTGLLTYVTTGYPSLEATPAIVRALLDGGSDAVELGVPFSDPLADGATIQRASFRALENGVTLRNVLGVSRGLREGGVTAPILLMGYMNPVHTYGLERFGADAAAAGVDGLIMVDLPPEEALPMHAVCRANEMDLIFLVAPTSTEERVARVAELANGFIYCVSVTGTTGSRESVSDELPELIARVRRHTDLPLAVGFGVSRSDHVARIGQLCEAAVIGSSIIDAIDRAQPGLEAESVRTYVEVVTGRQRV